MVALKSGLGIQAVLTAIVSLALLVGPSSPPLYVTLAGFVMVGILLASKDLSAFLRVFVSVYGLGFLFLALGKQAGTFGLLPGTIAALFPPDFAATGAVVFAAIVLAISYLKPIRDITRIADPYFSDRKEPLDEIRPFRFFGRTEGRIGQRLVGLAIFITFAQVALTLRLNFWYRDLFNALQEYQADVFWYQLIWVFGPLATIWVCIGLLDAFVDELIVLRWRTWLTRSLYQRWLANGTHFRIPFTGETADNPDQRIQNDVELFIRQTMALSIRLLSQAATLVSFIVVLWTLSRDFVLPFTDSLVIPGFLVWTVVAYAVVGTWLTHLLGRPLIGLNFHQEKVEADFRFSLARNRVYSEQIALLRGEQAESARLKGMFGAIIGNTLRILYRRIKLGTFTLSYNQLSVVFPYILAAPSYFLKKITLGHFQQTANAFSNVQTALSFFIDSYRTIASYRATTNRLTSFSSVMAEAESLADKGYGLEQTDSAKTDVTAKDLVLGLPDGREIMRVASLALPKGQSTLLTGPSGSGKSTLFRAIVGIWPFGKGRVDVPKGQSALVLPQQPYIPLGTLRGAVSYPNTTDAFSDDAIRDALIAAQLPKLAEDLDKVDAWDQRLSGGEKQRLAIARAILAKPDWLFLDESTAALDEKSEAGIYRMLREKLPGTTIVSIGHRSTLFEFHNGRIDLQPANDGIFEPKPMPSPVAAE